MKTELRSAQALALRVSTNQVLQAKIKNDPVNELQKLAQEVIHEVSPLSYDKWIYRLVVGALGFTIITVVIGAIILAASPSTSPRETPQILTAIGSAAVGALAGLLAPSPTK